MYLAFTLQPEIFTTNTDAAFLTWLPRKLTHLRIRCWKIFSDRSNKNGINLLTAIVSKVKVLGAQYKLENVSCMLQLPYAYLNSLLAV